MSVIFRLDGLDAVLTFLISGSASAKRAAVPPASKASDDFNTLRRLTSTFFSSDISALLFLDQSCALILVQRRHLAYGSSGVAALCPVRGRLALSSRSLNSSRDIFSLSG